jgi:hypothetical protein
LWHSDLDLPDELLSMCIKLELFNSNQFEQPSLHQSFGGYQRATKQRETANEAKRGSESASVSFQASATSRTNGNESEREREREREREKAEKDSAY